MNAYTPTRAAALEKLNAFMPLAGRSYAKLRNFDLPGHPHVSGLSPYLRHRVITEQEVLATVLSHHSASAAEKFIQEVCWRTYWKGTLERRPSLWTDYRAGLHAAQNRIMTEAGLRRDWESACKGETGIDCFDFWANELTTTGYLHNHARMWFASIWVFTLRLPWELGADFFLRHLLDGDPASNTLSWRWVGGLQTVGKTYLARPDNIAHYTDMRFRPQGLATVAPPLDGRRPPSAMAPPRADPLPTAGRIGLLLTEEDLSPDWLIGELADLQGSAILAAEPSNEYMRYAPHVTDFKSKIIEDCRARLSRKMTPPKLVSNPETIADWASDLNLGHIIMAHVPVGPTADRLADLHDVLAASGILLHRAIRPYDATGWKHATAGFFKFRTAIPNLLNLACADAPAGPLFSIGQGEQ